jgi:hypothetical protein
MRENMNMRLHRYLILALSLIVLLGCAGPERDGMSSTFDVGTHVGNSRLGATIAARYQPLAARNSLEPVNVFA